MRNSFTKLDILLIVLFSPILVIMFIHLGGTMLVGKLGFRTLEKELLKPFIPPSKRV